VQARRFETVLFVVLVGGTSAFAQSFAPGQTQGKEEKIPAHAPIRAWSEPRFFGRLGHYIGTHKGLLAADAIVVLACSADAASTVHDVRAGFPETDPLLGTHPGAARTYALLEGEAVGVVAVNHVIANRVRHGHWRELVWPLAAGTAFGHAQATKNNADLANAAPWPPPH